MAPKITIYPYFYVEISYGTHRNLVDLERVFDCKIDFSRIFQKQRVAATAGRSRGLSATVLDQSKSREAGSDLATLHPTPYHEFSYFSGIPIQEN